MEKKCCIHPNNLSFHCPECQKEKDRVKAIFSGHVNDESLRSMQSRKGIPHEIQRHEDHDNDGF